MRAVLRSFLDAHDDLVVVEEVGDARAVAASVARQRPAVLVRDLGLPGDRGLEAISRARTASPGTAVVVLTMQADPAFARRALALGALGFVLKESADPELVEAVRRAARGERYLSSALGDVADAGSGGARDTGALTPREVEVLRLVALGHTNAEIADRLLLSVRAIEADRARLQRRLGRWRRADLVAYALDHGLLAAEAENCGFPPHAPGREAAMTAAPAVRRIAPWPPTP
jgi:two-component system response regulator NreC